MQHDAKTRRDLKCPVCGQRQNRVIDTRFDSGAGWNGKPIVEESVRRRRQCVCGARFTTREHVYEVIDRPARSRAFLYASLP